MCNLSENKFEIATHSNKESRTYTADTESLHLLKEDTERKFENGLGVLMPIWGVNGIARYSDTVLTFCLMAYWIIPSVAYVVNTHFTFSDSEFFIWTYYGSASSVQVINAIWRTGQGYFSDKVMNKGGTAS